MTGPDEIRRLIEQLREYADMLERADVHDDMGLSLMHNQCADLMRTVAALLPSASPQAEREAWRAYVRHLDTCHLSWCVGEEARETDRELGAEHVCTCGLDELLTAAHPSAKEG